MYLILSYCHLTLVHDFCLAVANQMSGALFPPELLLWKLIHSVMTLLIKQIGLYMIKM